MSNRPNIVWIVSDHQIHASRPPRFDQFPLQARLRQLGTEFTKACSVLPVCSPARASMLTARYPHAHGLTENDGRFGGHEGLETDQWMVHQPLLESGYRCGWFGKWHVDNRRSAIEYGFEGYSLPGYGYPYGSERYRQYLRRNRLDSPTAQIELVGESGTTSGSRIKLTKQESWFDYESGSAILDGAAETHEAYFLADEAIQWIRSVGDAPFFVRVDTWGPHPPYLVAPPFRGMLDSHPPELPENFGYDLADRPRHHRDYRDYWQTTLEFDNAQWRLLYQRALEHVIQVETALCRLLDNVNLDNTLVIFTSDHGDAVGSNGAVANKGGLMAEATMGIPLLMAGPTVPAGQRRDHWVSNLDLPQTVLDACGVREPETLHGRSLLPLIRDSGIDWRSGLMAQHYGLHVPLTQRAWYQGDWKLVLQQDGFNELYQLSRDPGEQHNLAAQSRHASKLHELKDELSQAMNEFNDSPDIFKF